MSMERGVRSAPSASLDASFVRRDYERFVGFSPFFPGFLSLNQLKECVESLDLGLYVCVKESVRI